jgi:Aminoglycoside-2''-adenylyltransferase
VANYEMTAADVVTLMRALDADAVQVCLSGGWAIDALLGAQTRRHADLDLWLEAAALEGLFGWQHPRAVHAARGSLVPPRSGRRRCGAV